MSRIYVGNLSHRLRERDLDDEFGRYGRIRDIFLKSGFAFIEFERPDDASYAIRKLDGVTLDGQRLQVEKAKEAPKRGPRPGQSTGFRVTVENLSVATSWQDLKDFGRTGGRVLYTDVHNERGGKVGVIEFETKEDMEEAIDRLDGRDLQGNRVKLFKEGGGGGGGGGRDDRKDDRDDRKDDREDRSDGRDDRKDDRDDDRNGDRKKSRSRSRSRSPRRRDLSRSPRD